MLTCQIAGRLAVTIALAAMLPACVTTPTANVAEAGSPLDRAITLLQVQSRSEDPATRANCIEALQPSPDARAAAVIEQGLHDPAWVVRYAATMTIAKRKNAGYRLILTDLAAKDPDDSVRVGATYALRQLGDKANMNLLAKTLQSPDPSVRANTAFVLGLIGDRSAVPLLQAAVARETDSRVKFEVTAALARLGNKNAQDIIVALALSKFAEDHWNAMAVCGDLPVEVAANPLLLGLHDAPPQVPADVRGLTTRRQLVAARSLGKQGSLQGAKVALDNLENSDPALRSLAAFAVGELARPPHDRGLASLLDDPNPGVQRAAAAAIINIHARAGK